MSRLMDLQCLQIQLLLYLALYGLKDTSRQFHVKHMVWVIIIIAWEIDSLEYPHQSFEGDTIQNMPLSP